MKKCVKYVKPLKNQEVQTHTMHAHRFGMNFEETIVGKLTEVYQTVHLKEFTDFPKKDENLKDPTKIKEMAISPTLRL